MLSQSSKTTVLLKEVIHGLNIFADGVYIDGTFGEGGHSRVILSRLNQKGRLFAIDRDHYSVKIGRTIERKDIRFTMIHGNFSNLFKYVKHYGLFGKINGILLDLGLSRLQLENPKRGFSFINNGPLDMRMDTSSGLSASLWLRKASLEKIVWVLKTYGEEKFAKRIARAIVIYRSQGMLKYTHELVQLIINSVPWYDKYKHPATRTFQAIRIYVNNELEEIKSVLQDAVLTLAPGGRLLVISFHSLEDRIVKYFIREHSLPSSMILGMDSIQTNKKSCYDFRNISIRSNLNYSHASINRYKYYLGSKEKIFPSKEEIADNTCARSAVLRCVEKIIV